MQKKPIRFLIKKVAGTEGPVRDIVIDPEYLDVTVPANTEFVHPTKPGHTVFAYILEGKGYFSEQKDPHVTNENLVLFDDGEQLAVSTGDDPVRFLLISGRPLGEPIAWYGPIVMNTQVELQTAFEEYRNGTFIKSRKG